MRAAVRRPTTELPPNVSQFIVSGLGPATDWSTALEGVEAVVHLAARVHVMSDSAAAPLREYRHVNVDGSRALAEQAARLRVTRLVYLSSIKVNGECTSSSTAFSEADRPQPTDPYGVSKAEAEAALFAVAEQTGLEVVVIRPPLVYGPGVKANFRSLAQWIRRGVPLPLGAIVSNRRSLIGVDNLVDLITTCILHPDARNEIFLASDGEDMSTAELARRMASAMGVVARLVPVPVALMKACASLLRARGSVDRLTDSLRIDSSKARNVLGWTPPVSVHEGLRRAVRQLSGPIP